MVQHLDTGEKLQAPVGMLAQGRCCSPLGPSGCTGCARGALWTGLSFSNSWWWRLRSRRRPPGASGRRTWPTRPGGGGRTLPGRRCSGLSSWPWNGSGLRSFRCKIPSWARPYRPQTMIIGPWTLLGLVALFVTAAAQAPAIVPQAP